jgi:hypothetical protein
VYSDVENILGLWEVKAIHNSDEVGYKETPQGMFKMVMKNGKFMNFMSTVDIPEHIHPVSGQNPMI